MGFGIKETFRVAAPVDRVWSYLVDPHQVVTCLPGAELTGDEGERVYLGKVKVKVGPVTASYAGRARLTEVNDAEHVVRMDAEGRESGGAGSAKLRMTSRVEAHPDGGAEVRVEAEVDVAGKIVQFGRGMIEAVSKQLFRDFVVCVRARLESPAATAAAAPTAAAASQSASGSAGPQAAPATRADNTRVAAPTSPAPGAKPVAVLPLIFRAVWANLTGWVARVFGRRRAA
ncbi:MAG: SRPBCC family protein [Gemmatimonadaceae bacterium]